MPRLLNSWGRMNPVQFISRCIGPSPKALPRVNDCRWALDYGVSANRVTRSGVFFKKWRFPEEGPRLARVIRRKVSDDQLPSTAAQTCACLADQIRGTYVGVWRSDPRSHGTSRPQPHNPAIRDYKPILKAKKGSYQMSFDSSRIMNV